MNEQFELHPDRLGTTDERGRRVFVYPADVRGKWRTLRVRTRAALVIFFLVLPWIHINGKQWLLLDIVHRRFEIFGLSLRAHDAPAIVFVLATAAFGLFFVTTVWGRVWCGWACPQTVFIEGVFRRIERWIEGAALSRRRLAQSPWTKKKIALKTAKWTLYVLASAVITHSFLAYFVGSRELVTMILGDPRENWSSFLFILTTTGLILFNFAWFREQFCIIMCPYGRFQSVFMDRNTMIVGYDAKRGEPRKTRELPKDTPAGDCVNCYRCVQVCPTGIDIRRGTQMECISCTACIDACDDVMTKTKRPTGLIRYTSETDLQGQSWRWIRPRSIASAALFALSLSGLVAFVLLHDSLDVAWLRAKGAPYDVIKSEGREDVIVNRFQLELSNQDDARREIEVAAMTGNNPADAGFVMAMNPVSLEAGELRRIDVFIRVPRSTFKSGTAKYEIEVHDRATGNRHREELTLVGPIF